MRAVAGPKVGIQGVEQNIQIKLEPLTSCFSWPLQAVNMSAWIIRDAMETDAVSVQSQGNEKVGAPLTDYCIF
jgi:hypothetical protein